MGTVTNRSMLTLSRIEVRPFIQQPGHYTFKLATPIGSQYRNQILIAKRIRRLSYKRLSGVIINTNTIVTVGLEPAVFQSSASKFRAAPVPLHSELNIFRNNCRTFTFLFFLSSEYFQVQTRSAGPVESVLYVDEAVSLLLPGEILTLVNGTQFSSFRSGQVSSVQLTGCNIYRLFLPKFVLMCSVGFSS